MPVYQINSSKEYQYENSNNIIFDKQTMASQNQKSILSQVTLDTSKINKQSLSTSILPPLHTGQSSYIAYKHKKSSRNQSRPLPFGSTSSRVTEQLEPKVLSHVCSYASVESNFKHYTENYSSPFGSSDNRFKDISNRSPGPGMYRVEQTNIIKHSNTGWKFSKMQRDLSSQKNKQIDVSPGSYQIDKPTKSLNFRQKIAQKYRQQKKKYVELLGICSNKQSPDKFVSFNQTKQQKCVTSVDLTKQKLKKAPLNTNTPLNRFTLKDSTKKYVLKQEKQNIDHPCEHISLMNKNFTHNFIEKSDNAFSSYIPKVDDIPGPGYYTQKPHNHPMNESFNFKSNSVRKLFPVNETNTKKQKPKLSQLL